MKKIFLVLVLVFVSMFGYAQMNRQFAPRFDLNKYEIVDSLPINYIWIYFNKEIDDEKLIDCGDGFYLAPVPHKDKMVIRFNENKTKAIVTYNSYAFGRHLEFDVQENDLRLTLYYQDKNIYCGYIYNKEFGVCKYVESKKEFNKFMRHPMFRPGFIPNR